MADERARAGGTPAPTELARAEIVAKLQELATRRFGGRAASLSADADLFEVLGIDSLQALDLLTDLEEAFRVEIPDYELEGANTLGALADVIRRRR